jgi:hypothetical protein
MSRVGASMVPMIVGKMFGGRRNMAVVIGVLGAVVLIARTIARRRARD